MDPQLETVTKTTCQLIDVSVHPSSTNANRMEANTKLNELTKTEIYTNPDLYVNVALLLISRKDENDGSFVNDYTKEIYAHFGFNIINELVKYNWYQFDQTRKNSLKEACIEWCTSRLFTQTGNAFFPSSISTSSLVLNTCSQVITEVFIREWPNNWPNFLSDITQTSSLVTVYSIWNISDYLHTKLIPANTNRRKEIIKTLMQSKETIYKYFFHCLKVQESQEFHDIKFTSQYPQLLTLKSLETLESLFEWFYLDKEIIHQVLIVATSSDPPLNLDNLYQHKLKLRAFRCAQAIVKISNPNRSDDVAIISDLFHDCSSGHFLEYLVCNILGSYLRSCKSIEEHEQLYELFTVVLDIGIDTICQVITLYSKDTTNAKMRANIKNNQNLWMGFINFLFECLKYNNACFDETLLKFLLIYCKLRREGEEDAKLISPIDYSFDSTIPLQLLTFIGHYKIEPKSRSEVNKRELRIGFNIDSYESYLTLFNLNRNKFLTVINELARNHEDDCKVFVLGILYELLGPVELSMPIKNWTPGIRSWNVVATLFAAILPKLTCSPEYIVTLEKYFERLLDLIKDTTKEESVLSFILSTLSSMSPFFKHFSARLIQQLIERIFEFTQKNHNELSRSTELQNHGSSLFIKLANNCHPILLPFFDLMRNHIDNLAQSKLISSTQFCSLYEGLLVLSNQFEEVEDQRAFIINNLLPKINWITTYDFGPNGVNFFRDIGLTEHPNLQDTELPYYNHPKFSETFTAMNLLSRLFKRVSPSRFFAITGFSALSYLTPFYKIIGAFNTLWHFHQNKDFLSLSALCHPFYQPYIFSETQIFQLNAICIERPFLVLKDHLKILLDSWNRPSPPSPDLIGLYTYKRVAILYSQSMALLSSSLNYLFFYYSACPSSEEILENFFKDAFHQMFSHSKSLPLVHYYELIKLYLRNVVHYCPRNEKFLKTSHILEILNDFLPFLFNKLDQKFQKIKHEKNNSVANSAPNRHGGFCVGANYKNKEEHNLEICIDFATTSIGQEFINLLYDIFSEPKNISTWASKFQHDTQQNQTKQNDDDTMDDEMGSFCAANSKDLDKLDSNLLLSNYMIAFNASPLVIIASNCLLWPLDNLRLLVCKVNTILLKSLNARHQTQIQTVDSFYYLAERIIGAINLTEKSDAATVNNFVSLFSLLYEIIVVTNNLTSTVNPQLAQICNVNQQQWDQFGQGFADSSPYGKKKQQKKLKFLLENVYSKETSALYSMSKPNVFCLGTTDSDKVINTGDDDHDISSLSWLL